MRGELWGFYFLLTAFSHQLFYDPRNNLSWKGSPNAIWSKPCSNWVTETGVAHAMHVHGLARSPPKLWNRGTASPGASQGDAARMVLLTAQAAGGRAGLPLTRPGLPAEASCWWQLPVLGTMVTSRWALPCRSLVPWSFHPAWNAAVLS